MSTAVRVNVRTRAISLNHEFVELRSTLQLLVLIPISKFLLRRGVLVNTITTR